MDEPRRVFGIFAHVDAGKTTLTEQLLHLAGEVRRPGSVDAGNTVTDWREDEQARGITISAAAAHFRWNDIEFDLLDTPGHIDFGVEVDTVIDEIDGAVLVISAPDGPQAQTLAIWRQLREHGLPTVVFVNKIDTGHVDLEAVLARVESGLGCATAPLNWPEFIEDDDAFTWFGEWSLLDGGWCAAEPTREADEPPAELPDRVGAVRARLLERIVERDDALLTEWLEGHTPSATELGRTLERMTRHLDVIPVVFGAASLGIGVEPLLRAIETLLPPPAPAHAPVATLRVLKLEPRSHGELLLIGRVLAGPLRVGDTLRGLDEGATLSIAGLGRLQGRELEPVEALPTGAIAGILLERWPAIPPRPGLSLTTSEAPCSPRPAAVVRVEPVVWCALDADTPHDHERLAHHLQLCEALDVSLQVRRDPATGQLFLGGRGELQLEVVHQRVARDLGIEIRLGPMRVVRIRTLVGTASGVAYAQDAQTGLTWSLVLTLSPSPQRELTLPCELDPPWRAAFEAGLEFALELATGETGSDLAPLAIHVESITASGGARDLVAPPVLRELASRAASDALQGGEWLVREPWVKLTAHVPWPAIGRFHAELARRGIQAPSAAEGTIGGQRFVGAAPLARVLGLPTKFREFTAGLGWLSLELCDPHKP